MTDNIKLPPLPEGNVAHLIAAQAAEIEALRAEVAEWKRVAAAQAELHGEAEARAERLADALREAQPFIGWAGSYPELHAKIDALLRDQEEGK